MNDVETSYIVVAEVTDLDDTRKLGRVKVKFPHLNGVESDWCPLVSPMGGPGRGTVFRPEAGDQVLVAFEHGDTKRCYIVGAVHSEKHQPPKGLGSMAENNVRLIRSRSGHEIRLDDTKGKERIEVVDKDNARKIVIDCSAKKIQIICDSGDVEVHAGSGNVSVRAPSGALKVEASSISLKADSTLKIEAGGALTLKGATVDIN